MSTFEGAALNLSDKDYVAFLIGRIIMAWGVIDQRLYFDIIRFERVAKPHLYPYQVSVDSRFEHRLSEWRRLCVSLSHGSSRKASAVDRAITSIKNLVSVRHHLAHGYIYLLKIGRGGTRTERPCIHVAEYRETAKRIRVYEAAAAANPDRRVYASDLHPVYSIEELETHLYHVADLTTRFVAASEAILSTPKPHTSSG
jgi:hypothetical protein